MKHKKYWANCVFLKRVLYLTFANKQPWKVMKFMPGGLVKPKRKYGKLERTTCTSRQSWEKFHLNHIILQIIDVLLSHSLRESLPKNKSIISNE
jgi:hypothetical protein